MADRISIDKKINDITIPQIDKTKFLGLNNGSISRTDLFLFAMAIGIKEGKRTPLSAVHGFILDSSIVNNGTAMSTLFSVLVDEMRKQNEVEKISSKDEAYFVAQEFANTGFIIINKWLTNLKSRDEESILWDLIDELDSKYEELFTE